MFWRFSETCQLLGSVLVVDPNIGNVFAVNDEALLFLIMCDSGIIHGLFYWYDRHIRFVGVTKDRITRMTFRLHLYSDPHPVFCQSHSMICQQYLIKDQKKLKQGSPWITQCFECMSTLRNVLHLQTPSVISTVAAACMDRSPR